MTAFFEILVDFYNLIIDLLNSVKFELGGYEVSYAGVLFVFLVIAFVVSVFWRGAKA